ncbi:MAG: hypothetical protein NVS9B1_25410 [Candidatus Dormibacteraceae bacterium]
MKQGPFPHLKAPDVEEVLFPERTGFAVRVFVSGGFLTKLITTEVATHSL